MNGWPSSGIGLSSRLSGREGRHDDSDVPIKKTKGGCGSNWQKCSILLWALGVVTILDISHYWVGID